MSVERIYWARIERLEEKVKEQEERIEALILTIKDILDPKNKDMIDILLNRQLTLGGNDNE